MKSAPTKSPEDLNNTFAKEDSSFEHTIKKVAGMKQTAPSKIAKRALLHAIPGWGGLIDLRNSVALMTGSGIAALGVSENLHALERERKNAGPDPISVEGILSKEVIHRHEAALRGASRWCLGMGMANLAAGGFNLTESISFAEKMFHAGLQQAVAAHGQGLLAAVATSCAVSLLNEPLYRHVKDVAKTIVDEIKSVRAGFVGHAFRSARSQAPDLSHGRN